MPTIHFILAAGGNEESAMWLLLLIVSCVIMLVILTVLWRFGSLWIQAMLSGAPISIFDLIGMQLRCIDPRMITQARIMSKKAGIDISSDRLEAHALAGGNVIPVVQALIAAHK